MLWWTQFRAAINSYCFSISSIGFSCSFFTRTPQKTFTIHTKCFALSTLNELKRSKNAENCTTFFSSNHFMECGTNFLDNKALFFQYSKWIQRFNGYRFCEVFSNLGLKIGKSKKNTKQSLKNITHFRLGLKLACRLRSRNIMLLSSLSLSLYSTCVDRYSPSSTQSTTNVCTKPIKQFDAWKIAFTFKWNKWTSVACRIGGHMNIICITPNL